MTIMSFKLIGVLAQMDLLHKDLIKDWRSNHAWSGLWIGWHEMAL